MIKRKQIEPSEPPEDNRDPVQIAGQLVAESEGDITKRAAAISQIAVMLSKYDDKAKQGFYIDEICNINKLKKTDLRSGVKNIEREEKKRRKAIEEKANLSKLDNYELFLGKNFNIRFNEIAMEFEITNKKDPKSQNLDEYAILRAMRKESIEITERTLIEILKSPYVTRYNPIKDYFHSLKTYDPKAEPDYINNLSDYLHIEDSDRFLIQFKKHLVRVIAGAFEISFNKHVLVLVGDGRDNQNSGKSTFIRWLTPPALSDYYLEDLPQDKDGLIALTDNFIINFDELESLTRYEINKLKSILSKETVKVRPPYGRRAISIPRRASFFGSTNEISFLADLTGNVRWIVFKLRDMVKPINWDYKKDFDINNVWRQAFYLFNNGFKYNLTRDEIHENEDKNFTFLTLPPEYDMINQMYLPGTKDANNHDVFYTATDFMNAISEHTRGSVKLNTVRLGKTLRKLGFKQESIRPNNSDYPIKGYYVRFSPNFRPKETAPAGMTIPEDDTNPTGKQTEMRLRPEVELKETPF